MDLTSGRKSILSSTEERLEWFRRYGTMKDYIDSSKLGNIVAHDSTEEVEFKLKGLVKYFN